MELVQRLRDHIIGDHMRGCQGRCYSCECGYDGKTESLLIDAADEIDRLRAENEKTWRNLAYSENDRGRLRAALERIEKTLQPADSAENVETVGRAREIVLATLNGSPEQGAPK